MVCYNINGTFVVIYKLTSIHNPKHFVMDYDMCYSPCVEYFDSPSYGNQAMVLNVDQTSTIRQGVVYVNLSIKLI